jgi:Zn-finger nucleic acid-binding protein
MPANGPCPNCGGQLVDVARSGVRIDACRQCRGVWLDRGELDQILERERRVLAGAHEDEEEFFREMTGQSRHGSHGHHERYGFDVHTAERLLTDFRSHQKRKTKHRKSFLEQLLD